MCGHGAPRAEIRFALYVNEYALRGAQREQRKNRIDRRRLKLMMGLHGETMLLCSALCCAGGETRMREDGTANALSWKKGAERDRGLTREKTLASHGEN
jgi:hypothetical protein